MEENYLEIKANLGINNVLVNKSLESIDFSDLSEEISYYPVEIGLFEVNEDKEIQNTIAYINGFYYDINYANEFGISLFDVFDMCSGDTMEIYDVLFDEDEKIKKEYQTFEDNIFYLDRIFVKKEYRGKGYAKFLLKQLDEIIKYMLKLNVGIIVVCAQPFEIIDGKEKMIRNNAELTNQLIKLYKNAGFKESKAKSNYLVKIIDPLI